MELRPLGTSGLKLSALSLGAMTFRGGESALLQGTVPAESLLPSGNQLSLVYEAHSSAPQDIGIVYLNYLDVEAPVAPIGPGVPALAQLTRRSVVLQAGLPLTGTTIRTASVDLLTQA